VFKGMFLGEDNQRKGASNLELYRVDQEQRVYSSITPERKMSTRVEIWVRTRGPSSPRRSERNLARGLLT